MPWRGVASLLLFHASGWNSTASPPWPPSLGVKHRRARPCGATCPLRPHGAARRPSPTCPAAARSSSMPCAPLSHAPRPPPHGELLRSSKPPCTTCHAVTRRSSPLTDGAMASKPPALRRRHLCRHEKSTMHVLISHMYLYASVLQLKTFPFFACRINPAPGEPMLLPPV